MTDLLCKTHQPQKGSRARRHESQSWKWGHSETGILETWVGKRIFKSQFAFCTSIQHSNCTDLLCTMYRLLPVKSRGVAGNVMNKGCTGRRQGKLEQALIWGLSMGPWSNRPQHLWIDQREAISYRERKITLSSSLKLAFRCEV